MDAIIDGFNRTMNEARERALSDALTGLMEQFPSGCTVQHKPTGNIFTVDSHDVRSWGDSLVLHILPEQFGPPLHAHTLRVVEQ